MASLRAILSHHLTQRLNLYPIPFRPFSTSPQFEPSDTSQLKKPDRKKPLDVFFKEAVGIVEKNDNLEEFEFGEDWELKKRLKKLEDEVRRVKEQRESQIKEKSENVDLKESKKRNLVELFGGNGDKDFGSLRKVEGLEVFKELSDDMIMFVTHLYKEGYFRDANFLRRNKLVSGYFDSSYARDFVVFAAEEFGKDNQEIAKWLSASDLKKVALFGCPSLLKKNVFAAKRLRTFFRVQEDTVCDKCVLKESCEFANQGVWKGDTKSLNLADIMRVITVYALEFVPPEFVVTEEIKSSVGKLLKEAVNLSRTVRKFS